MKKALVFLAVLICGTIAFGYTPSNYHKQAECAKIHQSEIRVPNSPIVTDSGPTETYNQQYQEYQDKRDFAAACSDLAAQWSVANITHRGFWLGLIGLGFLAWTLFETRKASIAAAETLDVAKRATKAEFQPYFRFPDWVNVQIIRTRKTDETSQMTIMFREIEFENIGKTPARNAYFEINSKIKDIEGAGTSADIEGLKRGDFAPSEKWKFRLSWYFDFPDGQAFDMVVRDMEFYLVFTFHDMFTDGNRRKYVVKYFSESESIGAYLVSTNEVFDQ